MKSAIKIISLFLISFSFLAAQDLPDTVITEHSISPLEKMQIKFEEFDFYRELNSIDNIPANDDPNTMMLWTSAAVHSAGSEESLLHNPAGITSPLYRKYMEDSKFDPFRYVLGMAQLGAVGYLAYKHVKKYGFLK